MKMLCRVGLLALVLAVSKSFGGTYNYRPILVGERAAGLGGAYTALSASGEGGFYNPAGLAFINRPTLSVAANLYNFSRGTRRSALKFAGDEADLSENSFTSVPQIASFAKQLRSPGDRENAQNAVALNVVVMEQIDLFGRVDFDVASGKALLTRSIQDRTLYVGPSYARKINDRFSLGISLFYVLRQIRNMAFVFQDDATTLGQGFLQDTLSVGNFVAKLGARYSPAENFWVGLTYQPPSMRLHENSSIFSSTIAQNKTTSAVTQSQTDQRNLKPNDPVPQTVTLGLAYERKEHWALAGDAIVSIGDNFAAYSNQPSTSIERKTIANFSVGGEYYVKPDMPMRLGFFSNFSSAPSVQTGVGGQADHVDFLGFSASGSVEGANTSVSLGTTISFGWGEGIDNVFNRIDIAQNNYGILLAGSYKF